MGPEKYIDSVALGCIVGIANICASPLCTMGSESKDDTLKAHQNTLLVHSLFQESL